MLHDLQLGKTRNSLDALQCLCFLGGIIKQITNAGHGSKKHHYLLHWCRCLNWSESNLWQEQWMEIAWAEEVWICLWTPLIFPENVAAPSYPWPINFLRSSCFCCKKDCKASVIVTASVERTWRTVKMCSSGFPLTNHLPQMDSSSWVLMS